MTAARLSPAASLLRNSKLFALPPTIALPPIEPSSEPVPRSDTATTAHPIHAAIETRYDSLQRGDWGLKRPLPLKSTTRSNAPVIRLNNGIDTAEHIADFDSAADHVLTLKKFQELNQSLQVPTGQATKANNIQPSVFSQRYDNTTDISTRTSTKTQHVGIWPSIKPSAMQANLPEAIRKSLRKMEIYHESDGPEPDAPGSNELQEQDLRWRYNGPSLVAMSGLEFDQYLKSLDVKKRAAFRQKVKENLIQKRKHEADAIAREEGRVGEVNVEAISVSEEDLEKQIRTLRQQPDKFGPLIAEFLDLPDGPSPDSVVMPMSRVSPWEYGRRTIAADYYRQVGPPRTHPSAGLSYIHNGKFASNHAIKGPQHERLPSVARVIKVKTRFSAKTANYGLAGFVIPSPRTSRGDMPLSVDSFTAVPGGKKVAVTPIGAEMSEQGRLRLSTKSSNDWVVEEEKVVHHSESTNDGSQYVEDRRSRDPGSASRIGQTLNRPSNGLNYRRQESLQSDQETDDVLGQFMSSNSSYR